MFNSKIVTKPPKQTNKQKTLHVYIHKQNLVSLHNRFRYKSRGGVPPLGQKSHNYNLPKSSVTELVHSKQNGTIKYGDIHH